MQPILTRSDSTLPKVTFGIVSFNRLNYLRATLNSARACIQYPNLEWFVVDGCSWEPGLREFLQSSTWINRIDYIDAPFMPCLNHLVSQAQGEYIILWPDDVQFIASGDWLIDYVEMLRAHPWIGSISPCVLRRQTISETWGLERFGNLRWLLSDLRRLKGKVRRQRALESSRGERFLSGGWRWPRVVGAGIVSISRTALWRELGPWKSGAADPSLIDSSCGGETEMHARATARKPELHVVSPLVPVAADIVDDEKGCKAKIRAGKRYGHYRTPDKSSFYYRITPLADLKSRLKNHLPLCFEDLVAPIGYDLPLDESGNLLKCALNTDQVAEISPQKIKVG